MDKKFKNNNISRVVRIIYGVAILFILAVILMVVLGYYLSPQDSLQQADVIVAVSGGDTKSRAQEAVRLYQQGYAPAIIFSGAASDISGPSNALAMRRLAIELGVDDNAIVVEEHSHNTLENASAVSQIIVHNNYRKLILVTSPYHQRRASIAFSQRLGSDYIIINHSSRDQSWRRTSWWLYTSSRNLTFAELYKIIFTELLAKTTH